MKISIFLNIFEVYLNMYKKESIDRNFDIMHNEFIPISWLMIDIYDLIMVYLSK